MMVFNVLSCRYPCCRIQLRFVIAFMCLLGIVVSYCHRSVLNIAIVEMVDKPKKAKHSTCPPPAGQAPGTTIKNIGGGKLAWTNFQENLILASFYIGYLLMHIPGGVLCDRYGARHFLIFSFILSTATTVVIPVLAMKCPWWSVFVIRIFTGAGQGGMFPGIASLIGRWIPPTERASVSGMVFAANAIGLVVGGGITGMVINSTNDWRIPFYLWGGVGGFYVLLLCLYVFSDPRTDPFMTEIELNYLQEVMAFKQPMNTPVLKILADKCTYGLIFAQIGHNLIMFTLSNNLAKYMNNVLGFNIKNNAFVSLIFLLQWVSGYMFGQIADYVVKKKNANVTWMRKIYTAFSNILAGLCLVGVGLVGCNYVLSLTFFAVGLFWKGLFFCGMKVNIIDITVNHSAFIMALVNGCGAVSGFACSYVIGAVAPDNSYIQWNIVFAGMLVAQFITVILYCILATCERRPWDYLPGEEPPPKKKANKWYHQMTPSDHLLRLEKDETALENKKVASNAAKEKIRLQLQADKEAARAAKEAKRAARG